MSKITEETRRSASFSCLLIFYEQTLGPELEHMDLDIIPSYHLKINAKIAEWVDRHLTHLLLLI